MVFHLRCYWRFGELKQILVKPRAPFQLDQLSLTGFAGRARGHILPTATLLLLGYPLQGEGNLFVAAGLVRLGMQFMPKLTPNLGFHIA